MTVPFAPTQGLILVDARLWGPTGDRRAQLALDTCATTTLIRPAILISIGYDPAAAPNRVQMMTRSGVEYLARLLLDRLEALGQQRASFPIVTHTMPPSAPSTDFWAWTSSEGSA